MYKVENIEKNIKTILDEYNKGSKIYFSAINMDGKLALNTIKPIENLRFDEFVAFLFKDNHILFKIIKD